MARFKSDNLLASILRGDRAEFEPLESRLLLSGTSYLVDSLADVVVVDGQITLREAIEAANTNSPVGDAPAGSDVDTDSIDFDPALFTSGAVSIVLVDGELQVSDSLVITGPSADLLAIDAGNLSRIFNVVANVTLELNSLTVTSGNAEYSSGGAIAGLIGNPSQGNYGSEIVLNSVVVRDSFADYSGGGVCSGTLRINNSVIESNRAGNFAGIYGVDVQIMGSYITLNRAADSSGGVFGSSLELTNSVVVGNYAQRYGGGVYCNNLISINNTIAGNYAGLDGGGIYCRNGTAEIFNSVVTLNEGGDVSGSHTVSNSIVAVDPHFVANPSDGGDGWGDDLSTTGVDESANDDIGDLRLQPTSAAIDFADTAAAVDFDGDPLTVDIDGNARNFGTAVDCGAYEYQAAPAGGVQIPSAIVDSSLDVFDLYDSSITLREALWYVSTAQVSGSAVTFDAALSGSMISLNSGEFLVAGSISIDASALAEPVTIDAGHQSRIFMVDIAASLQLHNLRIVGGSAADGGAVHLRAGASLVAYDSIFAGNAASQFGGAIYAASGSSVEIVAGAFNGNSSLWSGGGIYADNAASVNIAESAFEDNTTGENGYGGAISATGTGIVITESVFTANGSALGGGAIGLWNSSLDLNAITLNGNTSSFGGAVYLWLGDAFLANVSAVGNTAASGGAIAVEYGSVVSIVNSTITGNVADVGGGLWSDASDLALANSIVAMNTATDENDIYGTAQSDNCLIGVDPLFLSAPDGGSDGWGDDPLTPEIDESANDFYGDLRLSPDSPAIDAGDDLLAVSSIGDPLDTDIRGVQRSIGNAVDIGAYEFAYMPGDVDGNEVVNIFDFLIFRGNYGTLSGATWSQGDFDGNGSINIFDFLLLRSNYGL